MTVKLKRLGQQVMVITGASSGIGLATARRAAAAGAFLWSRRDQITDTINSGMDSLSEAKSRRFGGKSQEEISQEAMPLKETGRKTRGPRGPLAQQDIKAGVASSNHEMKAGAQAFS